MAADGGGLAMECWIPEEEDIDVSRPWGPQEESLYRIFQSEFIASKPMFGGIPVNIRANPRFDKKEESFWHLTCRDYAKVDGLPESRVPDIGRCRKIRWPRAFIEKHPLCVDDEALGDTCGGVLVWRSTHKPKKGRPKERVKMLLEEESYLVVLESRGRYYLLITAYPLEEESLERTMREARKKGAVNAGSAG